MVSEAEAVEFKPLFHPQCTASLETGHNVLNTKRFDALATTQGIRAPDRLDFLTSGASQIFKRLRPLCLSTRRRPPGPRRRRATDRHHVSQAIAAALLPMASTSDLTAVSQLSHRPAALRPAEPFASPENRRPRCGRGRSSGTCWAPTPFARTDALLVSKASESWVLATRRVLHDRGDHRRHHGGPRQLLHGGHGQPGQRLHGHPAPELQRRRCNESSDRRRRPWSGARHLEQRPVLGRRTHLQPPPKNQRAAEPRES